MKAVFRETREQTRSARLALVLEWLALASSAVILGHFLLPIAGAPSLNPDSGTALSLGLALAEGEPSYLIQGLFPPIQTAVYAFMFIQGWIHSATIIPVVLSFSFAIVLGAIALDYTRKPLTAAAPVILLLFSGVFWRQSGLLTFYPAFVLLGTAGIYLAGKYILTGQPTIALGLLAGALLAGSLYAFTTGLLFLPIPALLLLCYLDKHNLRRTMVVYSSIAVFSAPWFVWHLWVGGSRFYYHPLTWFIEKYLPIVNSQFWRFPQESIFEYVPRALEVGFSELLAGPAWILVGLGTVYIWRQHGARGALFVLACTLLFFVSVAVTRPAPYARYFYPILPLVILLGTAGFSMLNDVLVTPSLRLLRAGSALAALILVVVVTPGVVNDVQFRFVGRLDSSPGYGELKDIVALIDDGRAIIGRDSVIQALLPRNQVRTHFLVNEIDYVTYLSWPSEEEVLAVLAKYDIGWVMLYKEVAYVGPSPQLGIPANRWENDYHIWLTEAYSLTPRHYVAIRSAVSFEQVYDGWIYSLYKVKK